MENWVDIEEEYYNTLVACLKKPDEVKKLHEDFHIVQIALEIYLVEQCKNKVIEIPTIEQHIFSSLSPEDFINKPNTDTLNYILFLNFNYTQTANIYNNPEVIFEELYLADFNKLYIEKKQSNKLETNTILKYMESHQIEHIPVDYAEIPSQTFFKLHMSMLQDLERRSHGYRQIHDSNMEFISLYGFNYLNSNDYIKEKM